MRFIDLFSGLGGFHLALARLGHDCVFASEINKDLADLYEKNFKISNVHSDIKSVHVEDIPDHDIMCAGFPCQPFSKAGKQLGINDERGQFIVDFERILTRHKPKYFILENVPNLRRHDREETWREIKEVLESCNYTVYDEILSPHEFGIPQIRKRIYIVGIHNSVKKKFEFPKPSTVADMDVRNILEREPKNVKKMSKEQIQCINLWQSIIRKIPDKDKLPSFPIWSMEFRSTYPFEKKNPQKMTLKELRKVKGVYGRSLKNVKSKKEALELLPSYARTKTFPDWKKSYIRGNREFYKQYKKIIDPFIPQLKKFPPSWQKLEWNCQDEKRDLFNYIIQFRASGIRVKRTNYAPALVVSSTQLPIIGWERRYLTKEEAAKLQEIEGIELPEADTAAYKALGNAINVHIVYLIAKKLIGKKRGRPPKCHQKLT